MGIKTNTGKLCHAQLNLRVFREDKSIAAVNTAVHRSKLTIAAVNQNSTVTWLALRRRGRGRGLGRVQVYAGVSLILFMLRSVRFVK